MLQGTLSEHVVTTYGLTRDSILNESKFFHVTEGLPPGCMHDMLEGTFQYEVKEMVKYLTQEKIITLDDIITWINHFPYCQCDAVNKPSTIAISSNDNS